MPRLAKVERKIEYLDFPLMGGEIKEFNDAKGTIGGYANYKNNLDFTDDITRDGAFRKTIQDAFSRKNTQGLDYLYPYLWSHDFNQIPPGGVYDADEDKKGFYTRTQFNLDMQMGREIYSSFKMGTLKKQSIGYKCIQSNFEKDAATGRTIRNLLEIAVLEISAVVFPANDLAQVDTVKNRSIFYMGDLQTKGTASGKTSWPLMDIGTEWTGSKAEKQIFAWAKDSDGNIQGGKASQCFLWYDSANSDVQSGYKMPFCYIVDGSPKIVPLGVRACAGVLAGGMGGGKFGGASAAMKTRVGTMYGRINSQFKPDPEWVVPWKKGKSMDIWSKDYTESYQMMTQQDWVSDLWNLWYPLRNEILQAFVTGDTPVEDVQKAITQFTTATINYVQRGIELNMTDCLQPDDDSSPMPGMYMSADDNPETKAGRMISEANHAKIAQATDGIMQHVKAIKGVLNSAAQRANDLQGYPVYPTSSADPTPEQKTDDDDEQEPKEEPYIDVHTKLHDLVGVLSADNAYRGI